MIHYDKTIIDTHTIEPNVSRLCLTTHREPPVNLFLRLSICHPLRDGQTPEPASVQGQVDTSPFMGVAKRDTGQLVTAEVHIYSRLVGGEGLEHRRSVRSICVWGRGDELSSNEIM